MSEIAKLNEPLGTYCAVDVAIYNRQNQILLGERLVKAGFKMWGFPGGHLNPYEKISECAQREIREELGGKIKIALQGNILAVRENSIPPYYLHHVTIIIEGRLIEGEAVVNEPEKCRAWQWFDLDKLPKNLFSGIRETLENHQKLKHLVVSDWQTQ